MALQGRQPMALREQAALTGGLLDTGPASPKDGPSNARLPG